MKYTATAPITLPAGTVLGLSKAQAADRSHALEEASRKGFYTTTAPVQFKAGESFDFAGDLPKALAVNLEAEAKARAKQAVAEKEAAAAAEAAAAEAAAAAEKAAADAAAGKAQA